MALSELMRHTVDVYSKTYSTDSGGGRVPTWSTLKESALPCNVQSALSTVIQDYKQRDEVVTNTMYWIDPTVTLTISDRVVFNNQNFKVVGLNSDNQRGFWFSAFLQIELAA